MNDEELNTYRAMFDEDTLRFLVTIFAFELYGLVFLVEDFTRAKLTPNGRELAGRLFEEEEYRDYAIERVDSARQGSSKADLIQ